LSGGELVIRPSYVPFLGKGLRFFLLAAILYFAVAVVPPLPELVSLIVTAAIVIFIMVGILAFIIGAIKRNFYTYTLDEEGIIISREFLGRQIRRIPYSAISDVQVNQSAAGRICNYGDVIPVTKSGFGLTADERYAGEAYVTEMTDTPNPKEIAGLILRRVFNSTSGGQMLTA